MKEIIEAYLIKCGYTNITWHKGRKGYYIMGLYYDCTSCVDLRKIANEILRSEKVIPIDICLTV